jgi:hypothetical protein
MSDYYNEIKPDLDNIYECLLKLIRMEPDEWAIRSHKKIWVPVYNRYITFSGGERGTNAHTFYRNKTFAGSSMAGASLKDLVYSALPNYWSYDRGAYKHRRKIIKKINQELTKITAKTILERC